jgi:hypothetical protein
LFLRIPPVFLLLATARKKKRGRRSSIYYYCCSSLVLVEYAGGSSRSYYPAINQSCVSSFSQDGGEGRKKMKNLRGTCPPVMGVVIMMVGGGLPAPLLAAAVV